jgi:rhodanese-related sulfurtransferase
MTKTEEILARARQRGVDGRLNYAGAVTPSEAWELLRSDPEICLVDVRTAAERDWIGKVLIPEEQHFAAQWNLYPGGNPNPDFLQQLEAMVDRSAVILFLCRSGVRSRHAATLATREGFAHCFDILEGFEGDKDAHGHRKNVAGWCYAGLPWTGA